MADRSLDRLVERRLALLEAAVKKLQAAGAGVPGAVTLAADAEVLLGLVGSEIQLDPQVANVLLGGPTSGGAADPTFRALVAADLADGLVTYAKIQDVSAASKLLGRGSAGGAGDVEEVTLGTNLTMSGTTLNAAGGGGDPPLASNVIGSDTTITAGKSAYIPDFLEVSSGFFLEVGAASVLEVG